MAEIVEVSSLPLPEHTRLLLVCQALHVVTLSVTRCMLPVKHKETGEVVATCYSPAAYRNKQSATESIYLCEVCYELLGEAMRGHSRQEFEPVPHKAALQRFTRLMTRGIDDQITVTEGLAEALSIGQQVLMALPPCTTPLVTAVHDTLMGVNSICNRCLYARSFRAFTELEAMLKLCGEPQQAAP